MDLREGFQIEDPAVFVPWAVTELKLKRLLGPHGLREVTAGYFTITCTSVGGLQHELGFHFAPRRNGRLAELEFFRRSYADQAASFHEFQEHFETVFGPPTSSKPGYEGFPTHEWIVPGAHIRHFVQDRFGPEEHLRIQRV